METESGEPRACCRALLARKTGWDSALQDAYEREFLGWASGVTHISPIQLADILVDNAQLQIYD